MIEILSNLPLNGNIMNCVFKSKNCSPTSSATEQDFDVIKNDLFGSSSGMRVDKLLEKHINFINGRLTRRRAKAVRAILFDKSCSEAENEPVSSDSQSDSNESISESETDKSFVEEDAEKEQPSQSLSHDESQVEGDESEDNSFERNFNKYENYGGWNKDGKVAKKKQANVLFRF